VVPPPELLARGTEPRAATRDTRLLDRSAAPIARLTGSSVRLELVLHPSTGAVRRRVVTKRGALARDAGSQRLLDALRHARNLVPSETARRTKRMHPCPPERLVRVDVPHPGKRALVEQGRLDWAAATPQTFGQPSRREGALERLAPEPRPQVVVELAGPREQPRSEVPDISICNVRSVV